MAKKKQDAAKMVRVAEGVYRRGTAYLVPIYHAEMNGGAGGKRWHGASCGQNCKHDRIVDKESAREAKRQLEAQKRALRGGRTDRTVWEWAGSTGRDETPMWLQRFPRPERSTMLHNAQQVRRFAEHFRDRTLRSLSEDEVWEFVGTHPSAVKEIRACLNDAIKFKLLEGNLLEHYDLGQRRGRSDIETLSIEELDEQLLPIARREWGDDYGENMEALVELGAWTGMRPGELFMLSTERGNDLNGGRVNYIDFERGLIDLQWQFQSKLGEVKRPKWGSVREVVLLPRARAALERLPRTPEGWVFVTQRLQQFTQRSLFYYWDPVRRALQNSLPASHWLSLRIAEHGKKGNLDFYELRHYFGTALAHPPAGIRPASPYEIAQQMGHKDGGALAMRTYIHTKGLEVVKDLNAAWAEHAPRERAGAA